MRKGVTLIELLVVISILVILAVIFAMIFIGPAARARDSGRLYDSDRLRKNLEIYRSENDKYPESDEWTKLEDDAEANGPFYQAMITYLKNIPQDPLNGKENYGFFYKTINNGDCYKIHIEMEKRDPYEISGVCGGDIAYDVGGGGGPSPSPSGGGPSTSPAPSGGEDMTQECIENAEVDEWIIDFGHIGDLDKVRIRGLPNDCSGLLLTVILSGNLPNDGCGDGGDPELARASSIIANDGDNENKTTVDFVPNVPIEPIECIDAEVSGIYE